MQAVLLPADVHTHAFVLSIQMQIFDLKDPQNTMQMCSVSIRFHRTFMTKVGHINSQSQARTNKSDQNLDVKTFLLTSCRKSTGVTNNISNGCAPSKCPDKPAVQHEQYQEPEAKWNPAIVN